MKCKHLCTFIITILDFEVIGETVYLEKYSTIQQRLLKLGFSASLMLVCILYYLKKNENHFDKNPNKFDFCSKMLFSSLDALWKLSKTTSPQKLFHLIASPSQDQKLSKKVLFLKLVSSTVTSISWPGPPVIFQTHGPSPENRLGLVGFGWVWLG